MSERFQKSLDTLPPITPRIHRDKGLIYTAPHILNARGHLDHPHHHATPPPFPSGWERVLRILLVLLPVAIILLIFLL